MKIDKNYKLTGESFSWVLKYESDIRINKEGKETKSKDQWYFTNRKEALKKYVDEACKIPDSVKELIELTNQLETKINNL